MKKILISIVLVFASFVSIQCSKDPKNRAPSAVNLIYPSQNLLCIENTITFNWSEAIDPENDALEYNIIMDNASGKTETPITFKLPNINTNLKNPSVSMPIDIGGGNTIKNPFVIPGLKKVQVESQLNPNYSFDNFVEGDCNRLSRSAGYAVAQKPGGNAFNPLLLYGGVGLGKTHLAQAIGIEVKKNFPNKTVLYVQSEKFITQFIESIKNNNQNDFVHFYQMIDVLILSLIHI